MQVLVPTMLSIHELRLADRLTWPVWAHPILILRDMRFAIFACWCIGLGATCFALPLTLPPGPQAQVRFWTIFLALGWLLVRFIQGSRLRRRLRMYANQQRWTASFTPAAINRMKGDERAHLPWAGLTYAKLDDQVVALGTNLRANRKENPVMIFPQRALTPVQRQQLVTIWSASSESRT